MLTAAVTNSLPRRPAGAAPSTCAGQNVVLDEQKYLSGSEFERLDRVLRRLEVETGYKVRVLSRSRGTEEWTRDRGAIRCALGVSIGSTLDADAVIVVADRGLQGALQAGSSFLTYDIGERVQFALPPIFWTRLQREYGKAAYVDARGEAAAIVATCELILSCLRADINGDVCTDVPPARSSFF